MNLAAIELWALRSLAILAIVGLVGWRIYAAGERHTQAKWDEDKITQRIALEAQNAKNRLESTNRQNDVLMAEAAAGKAARDLADYRRSHPLRGSLSGLLASFCASDPAGAGKGSSDEGAAGAGEAGRLLLSKGARDLEKRLNETDELLAEADHINRSYAICKATQPKTPLGGIQ